MTKPEVPSGSFLLLTSFALKTLTDIFKVLISEMFGSASSFFYVLKSSEVSNLPSLIFLVNSFSFLQIFTSTVVPTSV